MEQGTSLTGGGFPGPLVFQFRRSFQQHAAKLFRQSLPAFHRKADTLGRKVKHAGEVGLGEAEFPHRPVAKKAPRPHDGSLFTRLHYLVFRRPHDLTHTPNEGVDSDTASLKAQAALHALFGLFQYPFYESAISQ